MDPKKKAVDSAKEFLRGLESRPRQPWDDVADSIKRESHPAAPAPKSAARPATQPADDAMSQAERIAERNRMLDRKTRYLRRD